MRATLGDAALLMLVVPALKLTSVHHVRAALARLPALPPADAARIGQRVEQVGRLVPGAACLAVAVVAEAQLRRRGLPYRLTVGVRKNGDALAAHAWLESGGVVVTGAEGRFAFTPLWTAEAG